MERSGKEFCLQGRGAGTGGKAVKMELDGCDCYHGGWRRAGAQGETGRAKAIGRVMCLLGGMEDVDNG